MANSLPSRMTSRKGRTVKLGKSLLRLHKSLKNLKESSAINLIKKKTVSFSIMIESEKLSKIHRRKDFSLKSTNSKKNKISC